jgi:LytS/YehU family sensor histidine kinase
VEAFLPVILAVYVHFYIKNHLFKHRKYVLYVALFILNIACCVAFASFLNQTIGELNTTRTQDTINITMIVLFSTGLQYLKRGIVNQYQLQELRAKNAETELNALKTQLNPHFLFNTLNNIYAINQMNAEQGSEMIMELSEVMRYHLHVSTLKTISLADEVQLIQSYIALEKLRLNDNCELKIDLNTTASSAQIAPLLLLPFIENAFKHGTHPIQPCFVHISLHVNNRKLDFEVRNSIIQNKKTVKTHIGLANTQRRLAIIYPNRHDLRIEETDREYVTDLKMDL